MLEVYFLFCCCCVFFMGSFMELVKDYGAKVKKYSKINELINISLQ